MVMQAEKRGSTCSRGQVCVHAFPSPPSINKGAARTAPSELPKLCDTVPGSWASGEQRSKGTTIEEPEKRLQIVALPSHAHKAFLLLSHLVCSPPGPVPLDNGLPAAPLSRGGRIAGAPFYLYPCHGRGRRMRHPEARKHGPSSWGWMVKHSEPLVLAPGNLPRKGLSRIRKKRVGGPSLLDKDQTRFSFK